MVRLHQHSQVPMNALRKSVRIYRTLLENMPPLRAGVLRTPEFREAVEYLRSLYLQYGRKNVRAAIDDENSQKTEFSWE